MNFRDPVLSRWPAVRTKNVISFESLELEEATVFRLFRGPRSRRAFDDSGDLGEVDVASALEVLAGVVVAELVLG